MGRGPKTKKRRPKSEQSGDENYRPGEDIIGKAMAVKAAKEAKLKKNKRLKAEEQKKRKREEELNKVVDEALEEEGEGADKL